MIKKILSGVMDKISNKLKREFVIPDYDVKRKIIEGYKNDFDISIMVETGTFLGDTVEFFRDKFEIVYSIELSEELAAKAVKRFKGQWNVKILQGDSGVILADLMKKIHQPALFWLDGHYSSEFYVGDEFIKTAKADKNTPIIKELTTLFQSSLNHVILIDDARLFNGTQDYPSVEELKELIKEKRPDYKLTIKNDIIRMVPARNTNEKDRQWVAKNGQINKQYIRKFLPSDPVIIDAGAHRGDDSLELVQLIDKARIHAFEPVPDLFLGLKEKTGNYPQITCYELALSDSNGSQVMHLSSGASDASSSLLTPKEHLKDHPDTFFEKTIHVKTSTLDEWAKQNNIQRVDFLWLDMQGFELAVLKASEFILPTVSAIHIEVSTRTTYENVPLYIEVREWLEEKGFVVEVESIPKGWDMGNVLFVRPKNS